MSWRPDSRRSASEFQGEDGAWTGRWDSTTLAGANELPLIAEIEVSFRTGPGADDVEEPYRRRVLLPLRPIDLEEQIAEAEGVPGATNPRDGMATAGTTRQARSSRTMRPTAPGTTQGDDGRRRDDGGAMPRA